MDNNMEKLQRPDLASAKAQKFEHARDVISGMESAMMALFDDPSDAGVLKTIAECVEDLRELQGGL